MPPNSIHNIHHPRHMHRAAETQQQSGEVARKGGEAGTEAAGQQDGYSFWDLLDVVNPLQHIPVVNRAYRAMTGDTIRPEAQIAGSTLMFGAVGFAVASADVALKQETGKDAGEHMVAMLFGSGEESAQPANATQLAEAPPPAARPSAEEAASAATPASQPAESTAIPMAALQQEQLRRMTETPGGSAAAMAAAGLPGAAAATLPSPGLGGGDAVMAAVMQDNGAAKPAAQGMGLAQYRAMAGAGSPQPPKSMIPPKVVQMANAERSRAAQEALLRAQEQAAAPQPAAQPAPAPVQPAAAPQPAASALASTAAGAPAAETTAWSEGGTPQLPSALIADLMMANLAKYEALAKDRKAP
ncbi:hypothetical protein [Indioceanicola profundi]|uniref:hypothetical protein n=1 Tax=Indioceanicola profundi TaxID=2220096 RepID=UPI000E6AB3DC|nr:hypothetical protein [Indioceanicola profundi]